MKNNLCKKLYNECINKNIALFIDTNYLFQFLSLQISVGKCTTYIVKLLDYVFVE